MSHFQDDFVNSFPLTIWGSGKFEQTTQAQPLSAVVEVISELRSSMSHEQAQSICSQFSEDELDILVTTIGFSTHEDSSTCPSVEENSEPDHSVQAQAKTSIRLIRQLIKKLCHKYDAVVWFLDDIQWADDVSLQVLQSLLSDPDINNFLCIIAERTSRDIDPFQMFNVDRFTEIEISNFSEKQTKSLIANATGRSHRESKELAELVQRRCLGNPFHCVHLVDFMISKELMWLSPGGTCEWDLRQAILETKTSDAVVDLLVHKIASMKHEVQIALIIAAHLGNQFCSSLSKDILQDVTLVNMFRSFPVSLRNYIGTLYTGLDHAEDAGLIEKIAHDNYRFAHDRVQRGSHIVAA